MTIEFDTCDLLDRDRFWKEDLTLANKDYLFSGYLMGTVDRSGILAGHAYSVLKAVEVNGQRLVLVRYV